MKRLVLLLALLAISIPALAFAQTATPSPDAEMLDGISRALTGPLHWQLVAGALVAIGLWVYRSWKEIRAIDTRAEYVALAGAVGAGSLPALVGGAPWQAIVIGAVASFAAFAHANSSALPTPAKKGGT